LRGEEIGRRLCTSRDVFARCLISSLGRGEDKGEGFVESIRTRKFLFKTIRESPYVDSYNLPVAHSFSELLLIFGKAQKLWTVNAVVLRKPNQAFSLVELLCTLAIVVILAVMLMGRGSNSRQKRDLLQCEKNLQNVFTALTIYAAENESVFPVATNAQTSEVPLSLLVPRCTTETGIFTCPGSSDSPLPQGEPFANRKISYAYYMGWDSSSVGAPIMSDRQIDTNAKKASALLFSNNGKGPGANHHKYGGNVLFIGGEVKRSVPKAKFDLAFPSKVVLLNPK
jgi:prepilin-type N-terminal cleavage/methylation domain-containing protein